MKSGLLLWFLLLAVLFFGAYWWLNSNRSSTPTDSVMETQEEVDSTMLSGTPSLPVILAEQNELGQSGSATIEQTGDNQVTVTLTLTGGEFMEPQPAHIHLGACPDPGSVEYPLENVVEGSSVTILDIPFSDILASTSPLAINVHKSATEASVYTACGDIPL